MKPIYLVVNNTEIGPRFIDFKEFGIMDCVDDMWKASRFPCLETALGQIEESKIWCTEQTKLEVVKINDVIFKTVFRLEFPSKRVTDIEKMVDKLNINEINQLKEMLDTKIANR